MSSGATTVSLRRSSSVSMCGGGGEGAATKTTSLISKSEWSQNTQKSQAKGPKIHKNHEQEISKVKESLISQGEWSHNTQKSQTKGPKIHKNHEQKVPKYTKIMNKKFHK